MLVSSPLNLVVLLLAVLSSRAAAAQDTVGLQLRTMIAQARHPWSRRSDFPRYVDILARLYGSRADAPVWLDGRTLSPAGRAAVAELRSAADQGLAPADYDTPTLDGLARSLPHASWNAVAFARFDLLLSLDLVRYLDDLRGGRVRPGPFGLDRAPPDLDLAASMASAVTADSLAGLVAAQLPALAQYRNLRQHLARYRRLAAEAPFVPLPVAVTLPGEQYAAMAVLRRRLVDVGDLSPDSAEGEGDRYAGRVVEAVRRFQDRHGLSPTA